jgi:hypothetical protein
MDSEVADIHHSSFPQIRYDAGFNLFPPALIEAFALQPNASGKHHEPCASAPELQQQLVDRLGAVLPNSDEQSGVRMSKLLSALCSSQSPSQQQQQQAQPEAATIPISATATGPAPYSGQEIPIPFPPSISQQQQQSSLPSTSGLPGLPGLQGLPMPSGMWTPHQQHLMSMQQAQQQAQAQQQYVQAQQYARMQQQAQMAAMAAMGAGGPFPGYGPMYMPPPGDPSCSYPDYAAMAGRCWCESCYRVSYCNA